MGVYATGRLIYGFVHDKTTAPLFETIFKKHNEQNEDEEVYGFEEMHYELQEEHHVQLYSVGYVQVDILAACDASASGKSFDSSLIPAEYLTQAAEYDKKIAAFLTALGIDPTPYKPGWHILAYMS
jgi:hypothetical protein